MSAGVGYREWFGGSVVRWVAITEVVILTDLKNMADYHE
jgi:hypothetical protein